MMSSHTVKIPGETSWLRFVGLAVLTVGIVTLPASASVSSLVDTNHDPARATYVWKHYNCNENVQKPVYDPDGDGNPDPHYHPVASAATVDCVVDQCATTFQTDELITIAGYMIPGCRVAEEWVVVDFRIQNRVDKDCNKDGQNDCATGNWQKVGHTVLPPIFKTCPKGTPCCP